MSAATRVLRRVRRVLGAAVRRAFAPGGPRHPLVSVIVPVYNVEAYLGSTIDSVTGQTLRDLEIILVDDGSTDGSRRVAARKAFADARIRRFRQENAGPGPARELGIAHARGEYLAFLDSDDVLPPRALELLVGAAREADADVAVGAFRRFSSTAVWVADWVGELHRVPRTGRLEQFPELLRNNYPPGKVYRRAFWQGLGLHFRRGAIYEDQPLIALVMQAANRIAVVPDIVYDYRARDDRSSISQRPEDLRDLRDRVLAWELTRDALAEADAPPSVVRAWYRTLFSTHFHWYLDNDAIASDEYWGILREAARSLLGSAPAGALDAVVAERKSLLALLADDRRERVQELRAAGMPRHPEVFFTGADAGGLRYRFDDGLPVEAQTTLPEAVRVGHALEGGGIEAGERVRVTIAGRAWFRGTPADAAGAPVIELHRSDGARIAPVDVHANRHAGGFEVVFELDPATEASHEIVARVSLGGFERDETLGRAELDWLNAGELAVPLPHGGRAAIAADPNPHIPVRIGIHPRG
ncbi:glycosyltransferase family 2 protein [Agromyces archimandritae]|uniref:Glycosyltransferase n=1 Tax=Agromyces archimandritae TaxID=2781962 RepID=A0A975FNL9_9MICO|nr:glycosyltransferase [Agromyces archimandritae]QTX05261.1 glycosyltransferase [Agromyces archimandritae]